MATYGNIYIDQGSDFETTFFVEDSAVDPIDLSYTNIAGQIRRTYTSETAYDFSTEILNASEGHFAVSLSAETTASMRPGRYVFDIYATDTVGGSTYKLIQGQVEVIPRVTRIE